MRKKYHKPPYIVLGSVHCTLAVISGKGKNITILGCSSASGMAIPPYFELPGEPIRPELLHGAHVATSGTVSGTG